MFTVPRKFLFLLFIFGGGIAADAQSTFGSINGTIHDGTDATVPGATITLHREESNTDRRVTAGDDGSYTALNLEAGTYSVRVERAGFAPKTSTHLHLDSRQQLRLDVDLSVESVTQTVQVDASDAGTITTDNASISSALSPRDVLDLPANYRGAGSTSPLNVIQTLPGVQPDSGSYPPQPSASPAPGIKFSIQGGLPSQSETTIDGISAQNQTTNNILGDAFPSAESIAEIRVDGVNNNAEYAQPGEITTVTKSGTNVLHGSAFWYFQNSAFDAVPYQGATSTPLKPKKVANDFGGSIGGPVYLPHLYHGRDRTFFFATYEGLRFPQSTVLQALVPTVLMKQGNFSQETAALRNPFTGANYQNATLPGINPSAAAFLQFYPDPNVGGNESLQAADANGFNYLSTRRRDISSNQYDLRVDQTLGQKGSIFARYTSKNISQVLPVDLALPNSAAIGQYRIFAAVFNYAFTPHVANEFRFGFTLEQDGTTNPFNGAATVNAANLTGVGPNFPFNGLSHIGFDSQITSIGSRLNSTSHSRVFQYVDNVTVQRGTHTLRLGLDIRHLTAITPLDFSSSDNYGNFYFTNANSFTGQEFADFLIGAPYQTQIDNVTSDNNGNSDAYAVYVQDNWKASSKLNLTFGLRYELHPAFADQGGNIGNFDPSVARSGTLLYPAGFVGNLAPEELANLNACPTAGVNNPYATGGVVNGAPCTPVQSNTQAGLPAGLRTDPKLRFEPRFGFAYRPFDNDRTAIRGGAGFYNITTSGALFYALTGTLQANVQTFNNTTTTNATGQPAGPAFTFPNISTASTNSFAGGNFTPTYGSVGFNSAVDIHWHDPYSLQTNISIDHDFGRGFGLRVSYVGLHTWHLVWQPELNQLPLSTTTAAANQPRAAFNYPNFYSIAERNTEAQADYHSGQAEFSHRFAHGLSFNSAYTYAKNLSDNQGTSGSFGVSGSFVDEQGGYYATSTANRHLDYGNVTGTRRHRSLTTGVYELPVGRGKRFLGNSNRLTDLVVGGWQISNIFVFQTGPFLTAYLPSGGADPSGTGSGSLFSRQQRPDRVANGNTSHRTRTQFFNRAAFACPGGVGAGGSTGFASLQNGNCIVGSTNADPTTGQVQAPIGRFGTESVGDLVGPGTVTLSSGASKSFHLTDGVALRAEGTFTNILNHTNLADPVLDVTNPAFGTITQARGSDFGGNRTGQVSMKLEF